MVCLCFGKVSGPCRFVSNSATTNVSKEAASLSSLAASKHPGPEQAEASENVILSLKGSRLFSMSDSKAFCSKHDFVSATAIAKPLELLLSFDEETSQQLKTITIGRNILDPEPAGFCNCQLLLFSSDPLIHKHFRDRGPKSSAD